MFRPVCFSIPWPILVLLAAAGCSRDADREIVSTMDAFFTRQANFRSVDTALVSRGLLSLINQTKEREAREAEKVRNSRYPTDKPLMIEGDIFTSIYEGQDTFRIEGIKRSGDTAVVSVVFSNSGFPDLPPWNDDVILIDENGWKIDNVMLKSRHETAASTKSLLKEFIAIPENDFR